MLQSLSSILPATALHRKKEGRVSSGMGPAPSQASVLKLIDAAATLSQTDPDAGLVLLRQAREESNTLAFPLGTGRAFLEEGIALTAKGMVTEAEQALQAALPLLTFTPGAKPYLPHVIATYGRVYSVKADYEAAIKYYYESIAMAARIAPDANLDYVYSNLGGLLIQVGRSMESAWTYLAKAEQSAILRKDSILLSKVYNNMGFASNSRKTWDSSRYYFNRSLAIARKKKLFVAVHLALTNIGITYLEQEKPDLALPYLREANDIRTPVPSYNSNLALGALGQTYVLLGKYEEAEPILLRQYDEAVARNQPGNIRTAHYYLTKLYRAKKDYKKAYEHAAAYIELNNTIGGSEIIKHVNEEEVRFRTTEKDKDLYRKKLLIERQQKKSWNAKTGGSR